MKNFIKIALLITYCLSMILSAQARDGLPTLKSFVKTTGEYVTLGDLLEGLDFGREIKVAKAPALGKKITISATYILKISKKHNINWQNSLKIRRVTVKTAAKIIRLKELNRRISVKAQKSATLYNPNKIIYVPENMSVNDIQITGLKTHKNKSEFSVQILAANVKYNLRGYFVKTTMVPTLKNDVFAGTQISKSDISWRAIPSSKITRNMILKSSDLIGMTPRRRMNSGKIIKVSDLKYPIMIKKGTLVSLQFETKGLSLSVTGKAITDGGYGEIISVMNIKSRKTLKGRIIGKNRLRVIAPRLDQIALLNE